MKKKVITISIIICIVAFVFGGVLFILWKEKIGAANMQVSSQSTVLEEFQNEDPKEIKIYDIEDGEMMVPHNRYANKHSYDWSKLSNVDGIYKYEDDCYISKIGVDVSSHQKYIDWKKVKESGVEFAILRIGYRGYGKAGKINIDTYFDKNYAGARAAGIDVGVYFFSQAINMDEVREEAEFVFKHLEGKTISYPVVYDLEKIKNDTARTDNLTIEEITNMSLEFCKLVEEKGYMPSVYGNAKTFTTKMNLEQFNKYDKWYADYPEVGGYNGTWYPYEFSIWQYTEKGRIPGISTNVDINIQFKKRDELNF